MAALAAGVLVVAAVSVLAVRSADDTAESHRVVDPSDITGGKTGPAIDGLIAASPATTLATTPSGGVGLSGGAGRTGAASSVASSGSRASTGHGADQGSGPGASTSPTTTRPASTTSTTVPSADQSPPQISGLQAGGEVPDGPDRIFDGAACGPTSIGVQAFVFDWSGIRSVTVYWRFQGRHGTVSGARAMQTSNGAYRAVIGPFEPGTAPPAGAVVDWWVEALDGAGNVGRANAPSSPSDERILLSSCSG